MKRSVSCPMKIPLLLIPVTTLLTGCATDSGFVDMVGSVAMLAIATPIVIADGMTQDRDNVVEEPEHCKKKGAQDLFEGGDRVTVDIAFEIRDADRLIQLDDHVRCDFYGRCLSNDNPTYSELSWPLSNGKYLLYNTSKICGFAVDYLIACPAQDCDPTDSFKFIFSHRKRPVPAKKLASHGLELLSHNVVVRKKNIPEITGGP